MEFDSPALRFLIVNCCIVGGRVSIIKMEGLGPEEVEVESRAIQLFKDHSAELVAEYRSKFGIVVGTDFARELFPDYAVDLGSRLRFAAAVQRSAAALADLVFDQMLAEKKGSAVLFTAGGTGAGKTSSIRANGDFIDAGIIFDGNFNSWGSSKKRVEKSLQFGCKVAIIFVHRHPVEAYMQGVIPRALVEGRTVAIDAHLRMHSDSISTFLRINRKFADNKNVSCMVLNNTGHEIRSFAADIDYLKSVKYDSDA